MTSGAMSLGVLRATMVSVLVGASLIGCAVGPDYVAPKTELAPFHNSVPLPVGTGQVSVPAAPLDRWWTGFNDPMLVTVLQRALDQNLDLAAAFARVQQARASARAAGANLLPTFDLDAAATVEHQSLQSPFGSVAKTLPGFSRTQREYTLGAAASWELDVFGALRRGAHAARDELQAAEADHTGTRITVAADVADAYLQIRGYQARIEVVQGQIDTDAQLLKLVGVRHQLGEADGREVAQAEALLKQARTTLPPLRVGLESQLNRLDVLMGVQPGTYAKELALAAPVPAIPGISGDEPAVQVLRRRPDVIAAERRLAASNERIGVAIADYYPKFSLSGVLGFDSITANRLFSHGAFQPVGTGALQWRLFDFGKVSAEVAQARGARAEALALYEQSVLKAVEDVEDALVTLTQTQGNVVELEDEVESLTRARDLSQKAYREGAIALTDVLDADRQMLVAKDQLESTRADAARAAVKTFRALGGGWEVPSRVLEADDRGGGTGPN